MTTSAGAAVADGDGRGFGFGFTVAETLGSAVAEFVLREDTRWYALNPIMASSTTTTIRLRLGERRSRILIGVDGLNTSAARIAPGAPCSASYSLISGSGGSPITVAMLRMWPRA